MTPEHLKLIYNYSYFVALLALIASGVVWAVSAVVNSILSGTRFLRGYSKVKRWTYTVLSILMIVGGSLVFFISGYWTLYPHMKRTYEEVKHVIPTNPRSR